MKKKIDFRKSNNKKSKEDKNYNYNPYVIPRNYLVEKALIDIKDNEDYEAFNSLLTVLKTPYMNNSNLDKYQKPSEGLFEKNYKTFCGT